MNPNLELPFRALRIGLGLGAFLAGLDKFFNILTSWEMYLSPLATKVIPVSSTTFMRGVGVIEMIAGIVVLAGFTRLGGYVIAAWLLGIAANLVTTGLFYDLAVRDVEIAIAAFTLARLSEARRIAHEPKRQESGMKRSIGALATALALVFFAVPLQAETWKSLPLMDGHCSAKMAKDPDSHPRSCAIQCAKGGYGVITADGKYIKFDEAGSEKTLAALQKSDKKDHLRATVEGTLNGDVITVTSIVIE
jgi:uncharacterized membrane protein YphA (DoxX/SURF4 family)